MFKKPTFNSALHLLGNTYKIDYFRYDDFQNGISKRYAYYFMFIVKIFALNKYHTRNV